MILVHPGDTLIVDVLVKQQARQARIEAGESPEAMDEDESIRDEDAEVSLLPCHAISNSVSIAVARR